VELVWRVAEDPVPPEHHLAVHLLDHRFERVVSAESAGYPSQEWRSGDVVWSRFTLPIPQEASPGLYKLHAFFFDTLSGTRLPVAQGVPGIPALTLPDVRVLLASPAPRPGNRLDVRLSDSITLEGFDDPIHSPTDRLMIRLHWRSDADLTQDYVVFVQLLDTEGRLVTQSDSIPASGALPSSSWLPGEQIMDAHTLMLPEVLPSAEFRLIAGLYTPDSQERLLTDRGQDHVELMRLSLR
jgi:hypothetical protein